MKNNYLIAGDWGTTSLRLFLIRLQAGKDAVLEDTVRGPGVAKVSSSKHLDFETLFFSLTSQWLARYRVERVILSGMVGSTLGWKEVPFMDCPSDLNLLINSSVSFESKNLTFNILGGLKNINFLGHPDTMRGEETQILGLLNNQIRKSSVNTGLVILPGTHNKWVWLEGGRIEHFVTGFTGELFALLRDHSILIEQPQDINIDCEWFERGVLTAQKHSARLTHLLFSVRARALVDHGLASDLQAYLLGLIIGSDIDSSIDIFGLRGVGSEQNLTVIASAELANTYQRALSCFNLTANIENPNDLAVKAYSILAEALN